MTTRLAGRSLHIKRSPTAASGQPPPCHSKNDIFRFDRRRANISQKLTVATDGRLNKRLMSR